MTKQIDSTYVAAVARKRTHAPYSYIADVLPVVLFEVQALGPEAVLALGQISARLRLDDGQRYKLVYEHGRHAVALYRMVDGKNGPLVATFANGTKAAAVWAALHPKAAAQHALACA